METDRQTKVQTEGCTKRTVNNQKEKKIVEFKQFKPVTLFRIWFGAKPRIWGMRCAETLYK